MKLFGLINCYIMLMSRVSVSHMAYLRMLLDYTVLLFNMFLSIVNVQYIEHYIYKYKYNIL